MQSIVEDRALMAQSCRSKTPQPYNPDGVSGLEIYNPFFLVLGRKIMCNKIQ